MNYKTLGLSLVCLLGCFDICILKFATKHNGQGPKADRSSETSDSWFFKQTFIFQARDKVHPVVEHI